MSTTAAAKVQVLLERRDALPGAPDTRAAFTALEADAGALGARRAELTATVLPLPRLAVMPFTRHAAALVSLWEPPAGAIEALSERAAAHGFRAQAWRVSESVPVGDPHPPVPADGLTRPAGVTLLTIFRRRRGMSDEAFLAEWHGRHTPKALRIHPLIGYVRNVVEEPLVPSSRALDGIVEERVASRADAVLPWRFFGGPLTVLPRMIEIGLHVATFLDYPSIENFLLAALPAIRGDTMSDGPKKVRKSDAEWAAELSPDRFQVMRKKGTEPAFTGAYWDSKQKGTYRCGSCGTPLFSSDAKFDSGTGWPSFSAPIDPSHVATETDTSHGMRRTEALCAVCDAHLGHVFPDGPRPTGERWCINSLSLDLDPEEPS